jgi:tRNA modification GTPase
MDTKDMADTIAAVATAQVEGAISIVRLSGAEAIAIADTLYKGNISLRDAKTHTIHYGKIYDENTEKQIDEVLLSVFRAPKTYTREDVVEINCHGGVAVTNEVLRCVLQAGARLATPGEFTKRAFLNGRIDLTQAEAVADMIQAEHAQAAALAVQTLDGKLSAQIGAFRTQVVEILAHIEVNIDYPEYEDVELLTGLVLQPLIEQLIDEMDMLLATSATGQIIKNGIQTAIIGRPNVGKSSLLNALLREEKAIVSDIAGTTRDIVEGSIRLNGVQLNMVDTAGIRETTDVIEQIGVGKAKATFAGAELVLFVLDQSTPLTAEDEALLALAQEKKTILVLNKNDLPSKLVLPGAFEAMPQVAISAQQDAGIGELQDVIATCLGVDMSRTNQVYLSNMRHITLLEGAKVDLEQARDSAMVGMPIDIITIDLQAAYKKLGEILGVEINDELLQTLFANFCLGK